MKIQPTQTILSTSTKAVRARPNEVNLSGGDEGVEKDWLIIYYGAGDNNLTDYLYADLNEIERVGSDPKTHLVAIFDAGMNNKSTKKAIYTPCPFKGAKVFYLRSDSDPSKINSPVIAELGQVNMAHPEFMANFIKEAMKKYPAKHVAVIISDHGAGWRGAVEDETHASWMRLNRIKSALQKVYQETGRKIDLLGWDACLMGSAEVAYALKDYVKYMVASEEFEGGDGWPYSKIFSKAIESLQKALNSKDIPSPEEFGKMIVKAAESAPEDIQTLALIDMSKMGELANRIDKLSKEILRYNTNKERKAILREILRNTESFGGKRYNYKDIFDLAKRIYLSPKIEDEALKRAAKELFSFKNEIVIASHKNQSYHPYAYGLQIEANSYNVRREEYKATDLAKNTQWDEAMASLSTWPFG